MIVRKIDTLSKILESPGRDTVDKVRPVLGKVVDTLSSFKGHEDSLKQAEQASENPG